MSLRINFTADNIKTAETKQIQTTNKPADIKTPEIPNDTVEISGKEKKKNLYIAIAGAAATVAAIVGTIMFLKRKPSEASDVLRNAERKGGDLIDDIKKPKADETVRGGTGAGIKPQNPEIEEVETPIVINKEPEPEIIPEPPKTVNEEPVNLPKPETITESAEEKAAREAQERALKEAQEKAEAEAAKKATEKLEKETMESVNEWLKNNSTKLNIPEGAKTTVGYLGEGKAFVKKENGLIFISDRDIGKWGIEPESYIPIPDNFTSSRFPELSGLKVTDKNTGIKYIPFRSEYKAPELQEIVSKYKDLEKADNIKIYAEETIKDFKADYDFLIDIIKLGEKDEILYNPGISHQGYAYIKKADGSILRPVHQGLEKLKPVKDGEEVAERFLRTIQGKKYKIVSEYKATFKGNERLIKKTYYNNNPEDAVDKSVLIDTKRGEFIVNKDGYNYYFTIKDHKLLDIKKGHEVGYSSTIKGDTYKPGKPPTDSKGGKPKVLLLQLVNGGQVEIYQMPNGTLIFPEDFHFPGSQLDEFLTAIRQGQEAVGRAKSQRISQPKRILA